MATKKFLDATGVTLLWQKIKLTFVAKESGKGLSQENFTSAEKTKLAGIAAGATANTGTVTGAKIDNDTSTILPTNGILSLTGLLRKLLVNGTSLSPDSSGTIDLGTIIREHQSLDGKVDKETGKGLSTNDFTDAMEDEVINHIAIGTCTTSASTQVKTVTLADNGNWTLKKGRMILVKFSNKNTQSNPQLNVNGTGAKAVFYNNAVLTTANLDRAGAKDTYLLYIYDGTYWVFLTWGLNLNTTYQTLTKALINTGTETTGKLVTAQVLHDWLAEKGFLTSQTKSDWNETDNTSAAFILNKPTILTLADIEAAGFTRAQSSAGTVAGTVTGATINGQSISPNAQTGIMNLGSIIRTLKNGNTTINMTSGTDGVVDLGNYFADKTAFETLVNTVNTVLGDNATDAIDTFNDIKAFLASYVAGEDTLSSLLSSLSTAIDAATEALTSAEIEAAIANAS